MVATSLSFGVVVCAVDAAAADVQRDRTAVEAAGEVGERLQGEPGTDWLTVLHGWFPLGHEGNDALCLLGEEWVG